MNTDNEASPPFEGGDTRVVIFNPSQPSFDKLRTGSSEKGEHLGLPSKLLGLIQNLRVMQRSRERRRELSVSICG